MAGIKMTPKLVEMVKSTATKGLSGATQHRPMEHILRDHKLLSYRQPSQKNISIVGGPRSYMLLGSMARLEAAMMRWSTDELVNKYNFTPVVVPNIIHDHIIERCGFPTKSQRSQVYKISGTTEESILDINATNLSNCDKKSLPCIAGTSEFALAAIHIGDIIPAEELPKRYCALSRCYRAETSDISSESGLYRVHYFQKVEMFAHTMPDQSKQIHEEFLAIQKDLFSQLELDFQILDMPEDDLGLSARRKFDIEAWMPGRQRFGEISSTSLCDDYQSSRLNIKYSQMVERDNQLQIDTGYVHTVNGTACSSIRTMIALCEQHQIGDGKINIPPVLRPYMNNDRVIPTEDDLARLKNVELYSEPNKEAVSS